MVSPHVCFELCFQTPKKKKKKKKQKRINLTWHVPHQRRDYCSNPKVVSISLPSKYSTELR
jgi:hypothetical protein